MTRLDIIEDDHWCHDDHRLRDFFFPVGLHDLYFDMIKRLERKGNNGEGSPIHPVYTKDFVAVVDEERETMLACVSPSYNIITNRWAYEMGKRMAKYIFGVSDEDVDFWRGSMSRNRGACSMDIRVYKSMHIHGVDHEWFAFVRVKNSYDKSGSLAYELGFSMETMDREEMPIGLLIPSLSLKFTANHAWKIETIEKKLWNAVKSCYKVRNIFFEFERMVETLLHIEVVDDEILPLFCRLSKLKAEDLEGEDGAMLARSVLQIEMDSALWIKKCGPNAYAALCAYADFAIRYGKKIKFLEKAGEFQSQLGIFVDELIEERKEKRQFFSLYDFIGKQAMEIKKKIKLMSSHGQDVLSF